MWFQLILFLDQVDGFHQLVDIQVGVDQLRQCHGAGVAGKH